jgi:transposase-like protein
MQRGCRLFAAYVVVMLIGASANAAAIRSYNAEHGTAIMIRRIKYLNNIWDTRPQKATRRNWP